MTEHPHTFDITAQKALTRAIQSRAEETTPSPESPDFEPQILVKCFRFFPSFGIEDAPKLLSLVRKYFVQNPSSADIPAIAQKTVALLSPFKAPSLDTKSLILLSVQITAALLSLMKNHADLEFLCQAITDLDSIWQDAQTAAEGECSDAGTSTPITPLANENSCISEFLMDCDVSAWDEIGIGAFDHPWHQNDWLSLKEDIAYLLNESPQVIPRYVRLLMIAPKSWLYAQYCLMNSVTRHALYLIVAKQRALQNESPVAESDFESWLRLESQTQQAIRSWLKHDNRIPVQGTFSPFISALIRRENNQPDWYSGWIRNVEFNMPANPISFWPSHEDCPAATDFQIFWRAMAWSDAGEYGKALEIVESHLAEGNSKPILWLLMAHISVRLQRFGQAEHALTQAADQPPKICALMGEPPRCMSPDRWKQSLDIAHFLLAQSALEYAKKSPTIEPSLLELAMHHGNITIASEAALCAFDAQIEDLSQTIRVLSERHEVREAFAEKLATRRSRDHLDYLWEFTQQIQKAIGHDPSVVLLEALSQLDDAWTALGTLSRALHGLSHHSDLYWCAAELWIDLHSELQSYDEAVMGIVDSFAEEDPRATRTLIYLIARLPKAAYGMLQTIMTETLGRDAVHRAFARIQNYSVQPTHPEVLSIDWAEIAQWMLPYSWQAIYRASRYQLHPTPEETAKKARRDQVLAARGIKINTHETAPDPAQWIHETQKKASDAFEF